MLLSVTATAMTFAQQSGENSPLTPVDRVTLPAWDYVTRVAYCQDKYFSIIDSRDTEHVYDSSFKEIYTVQSELIDNVFHNIPYPHTIINLNGDQQHFLITVRELSHKNFSMTTANWNISRLTVK